MDFKAGNYPDWTSDTDAMGLMPVPDPKGAYPWSHYFSALGGPGLTAFCGLEAYADAKKVRLYPFSADQVPTFSRQGETIFISSGASGVGSALIQLAKEKGLVDLFLFLFNCSTFSRFFAACASLHRRVQPPRSITCVLSGQTLLSTTRRPPSRPR